ncbi:MAG: CPBP family intramembrane metalloprotease [Dehalococcoidales bacterium]|nr:CPBP family intramembrane metalloprotease [Dehalococcoidales bacterium]
MKDFILKKITGPLIPYITLGPSLLVFHNAWAAILAYHTCMAVNVLLSREPVGFRSFIRSDSRLLPVVTTLFGSAGGLLLYLLWPVLSIPDDIGYYLHSIGLTDKTWIPFIIYFVLVNPWFEEYFWRGFLPHEGKGIILNDIFFSGYHIMVLGDKVGPVWRFAVLAVLVLGAWFWRWSNCKSSGLLPSLASHAAADLTVILVIYSHI